MATIGLETHEDVRTAGYTCKGLYRCQGRWPSRFLDRKEMKVLFLC